MGRPKNSYNESVRSDIPIGKKFGKLTVIDEGERLRLPSGQINRTMVCLCECGQEKTVRLVHLANDRIKSCGCLAGERHPNLNTKLYRVWRGMIDRCYSDNNKRASRYKHRGIIVCDEWRTSFNNFQAWALSNGYKPGLEIDRRENDGNYTPNNCRFVERLINVNNREITNLVIYNGIEYPICPLLRTIGRMDDYKTIADRISRGWDAQTAIDKPIRKGNYRWNENKRAKSTVAN